MRDEYIGRTANTAKKGLIIFSPFGLQFHTHIFENFNDFNNLLCHLACACASGYFGSTCEMTSSDLKQAQSVRKWQMMYSRRHRVGFIQGSSKRRKCLQSNVSKCNANNPSDSDLLHSSAFCSVVRINISPLHYSCGLLCIKCVGDED